MFTDRKWDFIEACRIMRVNPEWFVDARTLEVLETYLFYRPNPAQAYRLPISEQPCVWVQYKILLDAQFPTL